MDYLVALALVCSPVAVSVNGEASPEEWAALKQVAYDLEIATPDLEYWSTSYAGELAWCRGQLARAIDLPPVGLLGALPPHDVCVEQARYADQMLDRYVVESFLSPWQTARWQAVIIDQRQRVAAWDLAEHATSKWQSTVEKRELLQKLVDEYGWGCGLPDVVDRRRWREVP